MLVLSLEGVWARLASWLIGNRTFAFTTLMFAVLVLLGLGSLLAARLSRRGPVAARSQLVGLLVVAGCSIGLSSLAAWWLIGNQSSLEAKLPSLGDLLLYYRFLEAFVLLALPLISLGALFW